MNKIVFTNEDTWESICRDNHINYQAFKVLAEQYNGNLGRTIAHYEMLIEQEQIDRQNRPDVLGSFIDLIPSPYKLSAFGLMCNYLDGMREMYDNMSYTSPKEFGEAYNKKKHRKI